MKKTKKIPMKQEGHPSHNMPVNSNQMINGQPLPADPLNQGSNSLDGNSMFNTSEGM